MCFVVSEQTEEKIGRRLFLAFDDSKPIKEEPKPGNSEVNTLSSLTSALYAKGVKEMCPPPFFFIVASFSGSSRQKDFLDSGLWHINIKKCNREKELIRVLGSMYNSDDRKVQSITGVKSNRDADGTKSK